MHRLKFTAAAVLLAQWTISAGALAAPVPEPDPAAFKAWLKTVEAKAVARGLAEKPVQEALGSAKYITRVIELDRRQPEFTLTFWQYLSKTISDKRVKRGRALLKTHANLLNKVQKQYGVQPRFLVAFWGLESNFGDYTGSFPLVGSLATLSFDQRRRKFFTEQLLAALEIIAAGDIPADVKSSWAGAMGNTQFIPTTYRAHAIDFDNDGKRDLWRSLPDVFASSAKFLKASGWDRDHTWGREVKLPKSFDYSLSGLDTRKPLSDWSKLKITRADGRPLPKVDIEASLLLPAGAAGPAFLVYKNFRTTLAWNRSNFYALAVGLLSDRLAGKGGLTAKPPKNDKALSRSDIQFLQNRLTALGFDTKGADGIVGPATRKAIKAYQKSKKRPPDGFADYQLIQMLRRGAEEK